MPRDPLCTPTDHAVTRRRFLGAAGAVGLSALANPLVAQELKKQRRQVLFVWLDGGMSQLESWDPKPNTPFGGPFRAIPTSVPGIHISELLPQSAKLMKHLAHRAQRLHAGQLALGRRRPHPARRPEEPRRGVPVLRLGGGEARRPRRQRAAAVRVGQADERRVHLQGRRVPRPEVRRARARRRQAAGKPAPPQRPHAPKPTTSGTTSASLLDKRLRRATAAPN